MINPVSANDPLALVVEDDEHIRSLLHFMLAREGYGVACAQDGREASEYVVSRSAPAVVILDVMLPFLDGFQLIRAIRNQPGWQQVPVLMLTAKTGEQDIVRALDAGANDYVQKPFQPEELMARVRRLARSA